MIRHSITARRVDELKEIASHVRFLGNVKAADAIGDAAYSLQAAAGEFRCIAELAEHPKRYSTEIKEWIRDIRGLGWCDGDGTRIVSAKIDGDNIAVTIEDVPDPLGAAVAAARRFLGAEEAFNAFDWDDPDRSEIDEGDDIYLENEAAYQAFCDTVGIEFTCEPEAVANLLVRLGDSTE